MQLILGTVQLGFPYGINNKVGQPNKKEAFKILDCAYNNGIYLLDTASGYGESESIIGEYMSSSGNYFNISTKISSLNENKTIEKQVEDSLNNLKKEYIDIYYIHNFSDLLNNKHLLDELLFLKNQGKIKKIGISLYEPNELGYLLSNYGNVFDVVQIPFNILDSRWVEKDLFKRVKEKNIQLFIRSVFLQGLIFMEDEKEMDKIDYTLKNYIFTLNNIADSLNISMSQLAIDYVKKFDKIDGILIGCETTEQLKENIELFNKDCLISQELQEEILSLTKNINDKIIDPRKWD